jgi:hypothetical protein
MAKLLRYKMFVEEFLLVEASKKSGYNDEHAMAHLWNSIVGHPRQSQLIGHQDSSKIHEEIEKAKNDPLHPLHHNNAPSAGYTGGVVNPEAYYKELHDAADTMHALANHPAFANAIKNGARARVTGAEPGQLSDTWKKNGGKNKTSKADVVIGGDGDKGGKLTLSLKKGDSQLMSGESAETRATYDHASNRLMQENPEFKNEHKTGVMNRINEITSHMDSMVPSRILENATASGMKIPQEKVDEYIRSEQLRHNEQANKKMKKLHADYPDLEKHVIYEAATGHGKFGRNNIGTARFLVTTHKKGPHIHDTENDGPIKASIPRIALPKGGIRDSNGRFRNRGGNLKIDMRK